MLLDFFLTVICSIDRSIFLQLPYKSQLQRLFLNLCAHPETRTSLVQILMDMLMLDILGPATESNGAVEPSYRLYGCQSSVTYSRPQFLDGEIMLALL